MHRVFDRVNIFPMPKSIRATSPTGVDIMAVDFVADAQEAAILRIVDLLRHPDDLTNKLPTLRKKMAMERASIEAQLKTVMEAQLDSTQKGIDALANSKLETAKIRAALVNMDHICGDSENIIKNYTYIQKNFTEVKNLVEKFQRINGQMSRVAKLLDEDSKRIIGPAPNLLLIHYQIQQLSVFRNKILIDARGSSSDVLNTLNSIFKKLDQLEYKFDKYFWELARNPIELVKCEHRSAVVRIVKIIEVEEKTDEAINMQEQSSDTRFEISDHLKGRPVKAYRIRFFDQLRAKIYEEMRRIYMEFDSDLPSALESFSSKILVLQYVREELSTLFPARYNIFHFFVFEYHRAIYEMLNNMTAGDIDPSTILLLIKWTREYYLSMSAKLDVSEDLLEPKLLDGREFELMDSYVTLMKFKLSGWLKNILATESIDFLERKAPPESDNSGQYLLSGSVIVFKMFNQQLDIVETTSTGKLLAEVVHECCRVLDEFQTAWMNITEAEYSKFQRKAVELNEGLVEYVMALANDCMRSTEFAQVVITRLESMSDPTFMDQNLKNVNNVLNGFMKIQKRCLHILTEIVVADILPAMHVMYCTQWYEQDIMKLVVGTFQDYGEDFQKHMSDYLYQKLMSELIDRFLVLYLESFRNKNAKFKMPGAVSRMRDDVESVIVFFSRSKSAKRIKSMFEVIEKIVSLIEANQRMVFIDFYSLWKQFPDMPMDFVEKILSKRDDLDKAGVREIMDLCRSKAADEPADSTTTVFSKLAK